MSIAGEWSTSRSGLSLPRSHMIPVVGDDGCWHFSTESKWVSPPLHGVGSQRTLRAFGSSFEEAVLAWNANEEFAFRIEGCSFRAVRGLAERWRTRAVSVGQWLHAKNRLLDGERPVDLLAQDNYEKVNSAAEGWIDGSYV